MHRLRPTWGISNLFESAEYARLTSRASRPMSKGSVFLSPLLAVLLCGQSGLTASTPYHPRHPDPVLESWRWREFDQLRGLGVRSIAESVDGTMWFGLNEGVRSYDGVAWTTYGEEDGVLGAPTYVLQALRDGRICAGSEVGLSCFESGKWTRLFPPEGSIDFPITAMDEGADGRLWASSPWGALSVKGKEFTLYTSAGVISSLAELIPTLRFVEVPDRVIPYRPWAQAGTGSFVFSRAGISLIWGRSIGTPIRTAPKTVRFVAKGSPAEAAGLTVGDRVHSVERGKLGTSPTAIGLTVYKPGRNDPVDVRVGQEILEGGSREFDLDDVFVAPNGTVWFELYGGPVVSLSPGTEAHWQFYG